MEKDILTAACDWARAKREYELDHSEPNLNALEDAQDRLYERASRLIDSVDGW